MPISNATELEAKIVERLGRSDLASATIQDFIAIGEAKINRKLRLLQMQTVATVTLSSGADTGALPAGFLEIIDLRFSDFDSPLSQLPLVDLNSVKDDTTGRPTHFAASSSLLFNLTADADYSLRCTFYRGWDILGDSTNWLLTNAPDVYLYHALEEGAKHVRNAERAAEWGRAAMVALNETNRLDGRSKRRGLVAVDASLRVPSGRSFNITRGF
jgi:hypothetical protein